MNRIRKDRVLTKMKIKTNWLLDLFFKNKNLPLFLKIIAFPLIALFHGICGLFFAVAQRILSPIVLIRVGQIYNQRIGHFILEFDWFQVTKIDYKIHQKKRFPLRFDLVFLSGKSANIFLEKIVRERLFLVPRIFLFGVFLVNRIMYGGKQYLIHFPIRPTDFRYLDDTPVNYTFTEKEERLARANLIESGFNPDQPLICFYIRDAAYAEKYFPRKDQSVARYRDCDLINFEKCMEFLANKGYQVFRMGKYGAKSITIKHPRILDYTFSDLRSDFMDFYISSKCHFAVGTDSGAMMLPIFFRKPLLLVNVPAFHGVLRGKCLTLFQFKSFKEIESGADISLLNLLEKNAVVFESENEFVNAGIKLQENSSDEILNAVKEMLHLMDLGMNKELEYQNSQSLLNSSLVSIGSTEVSAKLALSWLQTHPTFLD